jgi:hypothetical protein
MAKSFDIIETTLSADVATSGTFTVSYPSGKSAGSYSGAVKHKMFALMTLRTSPDDFTLSFGATEITVTYLGDTTIPAGSDVKLQVEKVVGDEDPNHARVNDRVLPCALKLLDLGSPATADANGVAESQSVGAGEEFALDGVLVSNGVAIFDTPRNVVGAWTTASILTFTGTDVDGAVVVEKTTSVQTFTGTKAFKTITSVSSASAITAATIGTGTKIGLPARVSDASYIMAEIKDGVALPKRSGTVYLHGKMLEAAVDAGTAYNIVSPVAGVVRKLTTISTGTITTGGAVTVEVNTTAVDGLSVVVADGATEGEVDSDTPTLGHATTAVAVGDRLEIIPAAGFNASADMDFILEIAVSAAGALDGTFVAAVDTAATATTGDTRGTYTPSLTPAGTAAYMLLVALPDPANTGVAQYVG